MVRLVLILIICGTFGSSSAGSFKDIKINEFMASNIHTQLNPDYSDFVDWIELYNSGDDPVLLGDLFITDDLYMPTKWPLPSDAVIPAKGYYIIWADGLGHENHASFKLAENGEQIALYEIGTVIDSLTYSSQLGDISFGRFPDGGALWCFFAEPTFRSANFAAGQTTNARTSSPEFSLRGGLYSSSQSLVLSAEAGATIRFTQDGSLPSPQSSLFTDPLLLETTTVIRARAFHDDKLPSTTVTHTFVIHEPSTLPVICITTPPEFLFDEEIGITMGIPVSDELGAPPPFDPDANFWNDWERPVHIEYYETGGDCGLAQDAGIKIFGGLFGRQIRQKAFTLFARDKYGDSDFDYPLFPTKPISSCKRFLLRCSSNDFNRTYIRDAMMNTLVVGQMDVDWQAYQPALVYINGIFWGLYNIREKTNEYYAESNYDINVDNVELIEGPDKVAHGDSAHYQSLINYVKANDLSLPLNYAYVQTQMDVTEFMNYFITQLYIRNYDWLHQNIKCWREHSSNGMWRWLLYDLDWGFSGEIMQGVEQYKHNSVEWALMQGEASILFQSLMSNQTFKQEFVQRFATHLNLTFHPQRVHHIINTTVHGIAREMPRQIDRWGAIRSMAYWQEQLNVLHEFAELRPRYVFQHLEQILHGNPKVELIAQVSDSSAGYITVYDAPGPVPMFVGMWFKNIPIVIRAHANYGWRFVRWEGDNLSNEAKLSLKLDDHTLLRAVFERDISPSIVISEIHYNPSAELQGEDELFEFVELANRSDETIELSGYRFTQGIEFTFPQKSYLESNEHIIIAKTRSTYANNGFQVFQIAKGNLENAGEAICLEDDRGVSIDSVRYDDKYPWPTSADGGGPSLELIDLSADNNSASAWQNSSNIGGTPGHGSYTMVTALHKQPQRFELYPPEPNPFNSRTTISFDLPTTGCIKCCIFNIRGQLVDTLVDDVLEAGRHTVVWEATERSSGVYFIKVNFAQYEQCSKCLQIK
ncbi:CotH kinase family protein [candidate division KSB1 bacterium]|nr:CotH kinase family protein [candidate division KSB1 bacterium]